MQLQLEAGTIAYDYVRTQDVQPPMLFLHGALGVRGQFDALRKHFPERSQLAPDFPCHGESQVTHGAVNVERLANDVLALLDALEIEKVDIVGHSMGGYVGLVMAHLAPARVSHVVTLGTKFYWRQEVIDAALKGLGAETMRAGSQRYYDALAALHGANGLEHTLAGARALIADFARWQLSEANIRAAAVPVLISAGDRDAMVPVAETSQLFGALDPHFAALAILPGTPHAVQHVPLECFEQLVRRFLTARPEAAQKK